MFDLCSMTVRVARLDFNERIVCYRVVVVIEKDEEKETSRKKKKKENETSDRC